VIDSVDSINFATPASTLLFAGEQLHWTSGSDLHLTAGQTYSSVAANAATLFTREGGIKAIAGNGDVSLQANTGELEVLADKEVVVLSVNDGIEIKANKKIVLHAGQSSIVLEGGNITFACPGNFTVKAAKHDFQRGASQPAKLDSLPDTRLKLMDEAFILKDEKTGKVLAHHPYRIRRQDGTYEFGQTDGNGNTHVVRTVEAENLILEIM